MLAPKGFTQHLTKESYVTAQVAAVKKRGALRFTPPVVMGAAALCVIAVWTAIKNPYSLAYMWTACLFAVLAAALMILWMFVFPARIKKQVPGQFALYDALYGETVVTFSSDEMTVAGEKLSRRVEYAKTRLCVETPLYFLVYTDDDAVVVLEKAAFTDKAATTDFLRSVFARWYVRKGRGV